MSRYSQMLPDEKIFCYGFDRPLSHYFWELYSNKEDYDEGAPCEMADMIKGCTHGELLEAINRFKVPVPKSRLDLISLDLPF